MSSVKVNRENLCEYRIKYYIYIAMNTMVYNYENSWNIICQFSRQHYDFRWLLLNWSKLKIGQRFPISLLLHRHKHIDSRSEMFFLECFFPSQFGKISINFCLCEICCLSSLNVSRCQSYQAPLLWYSYTDNITYQ